LKLNNLAEYFTDSYQDINFLYGWTNLNHVTSLEIKNLRFIGGLDISKLNKLRNLNINVKKIQITPKSIFLSLLLTKKTMKSTTNDYF
jgi:hypothetical protein